MAKKLFAEGIVAKKYFVFVDKEDFTGTTLHVWAWPVLMTRLASMLLLEKEGHGLDTIIVRDNCEAVICFNPLSGCPKDIVNRYLERIQDEVVDEDIEKRDAETAAGEP